MIDIFDMAHHLMNEFSIVPEENLNIIVLQSFKFVKVQFSRMTHIILHHRVVTKLYFYIIVLLQNFKFWKYNSARWANTVLAFSFPE